MIRCPQHADGQEEDVRGTSFESLAVLPAKHVMSLMGAAVSISGFVGLMTNHSVKSWVGGHPYHIYFALIITILITAGTLNYAYNLRKRLRQPTEHDLSLYAEVMRVIPADGPVIDWLKRADTSATHVTDFPADVLTALQATSDLARKQPVGFDDRRLASSFRTLIAAITAFGPEIEHWTLAVQGSNRPLDETAMTLGTRHHAVVRTYDRFIQTAHAAGIGTGSFQRTVSEVESPLRSRVSVWVELRGFEPLTPWMQTRCSSS